MKLSSKIALFLLALGFTNQAHAGRDGGGGVVFSCTEGGVERVYLADTYAIRHTFPTAKTLDFGLILETLAMSVSQSASPEAKELIQNMNALQWKSVPAMDLLGDDDIKAADIPAGCVKKQLAIQNLSTGVVAVDLQLRNALTGREQALFILHESYVRKFRANTIAVRRPVAREAMLAYARNNAPLDDSAAHCMSSYALAKTHLKKVNSPARDGERACRGMVEAANLLIGVEMIQAFSKEDFSAEFKTCVQNFEKKFKAKQSLFSYADKVKCDRIYDQRVESGAWPQMDLGSAVAFPGLLRKVYKP